ncbi:MAG TPA: DUF3800 domain-containing protein [Steroidobacteraceae bacterium]|nr:DUF3800 domain-containing protein [Steroidobacteraceae bacterium]
MELYFDESGNTGLDLLNKDQSVFALASVCFDHNSAAALLEPLLSQGQQEVKYSKLKRTNRGREALDRFFSSDALTPVKCKFTAVDKRFYLITHLVDKLIEPTLHENDINLYSRDAHVGLVNVWYFAGQTIFPNGHWMKVLDAFLSAIRRRNTTAFAEFDAALTRAAHETPPQDRDFSTGLLLSRGRLREFVGVYERNEVFDPACDSFIALTHKWMENDSSLFRVTHDQSKPMKRNEDFLRVLMTPVSSRVIGYGDRRVELPLRIQNLTFANSLHVPQLQIADLIAGAATDLLNSRMRDSSARLTGPVAERLVTLFTGGMLPSFEDIARDVAPPTQGEVSLVDGAGAFMREAGYFKK